MDVREVILIEIRFHIDKEMTGDAITDLIKRKLDFHGYIETLCVEFAHCECNDSKEYVAVANLCIVVSSNVPGGIYEAESAIKTLLKEKLNVCHICSQVHGPDRPQVLPEQLALRFSPAQLGV
jgi:hypothetical protein